MRSIILTLLFATPLYAQSLDARYEAIGNFDGQIGETVHSMVALTDLEKSRSGIKRRDGGGFPTINISARTIGEDGKPSGPSVSFLIGPLGAGGGGARSDIFFSDGTGYYVADVDIGNRATLADFQHDDTSVSFTVDAELIPVQRGDSGFEVDQSRSSQILSGAFSGTIPE